eukprot:612259-Alexandrium_andersonii.AAC.1
MSASLVGSEMCIRDRCTTLAWGGDLCVWHALASHPLPSIRDVLHYPKPVSYTHLTLPTICSV